MVDVVVLQMTPDGKYTAEEAGGAEAFPAIIIGR